VQVGRVRRVEEGRLAGVDDGSSADRDVAVEAALAREGSRGAERDVRRLDVHLVVDDGVDARVAQALHDRFDGREAADARVREHRDPLRTEPAELLARLAEDAVTERDGRNVDGEGRLVAGHERIVATAHRTSVNRFSSASRNFG
jgi:hypothetical protein